MKRKVRIWFSLVVFFIFGCSTLHENNCSADVRSHASVIEHVIRDSIFVHDSVFVREKIDTVFFTKYRTMYKQNTVHDTVFLCDTLYRERVVTRTVESGNCLSRHRLWVSLLFLLLGYLIVKRFFK